jgi:UDP-glucose:(heptosyl)LPS alpha-1,3-glucosyltransferase
MMKIALVIPHFQASVGGAEGFAVSVTRELALRGHNIHIVTENGEKTDWVRLHELPLKETSRILDNLVPDVAVDWGLRVGADLHRLGGGMHRAFLRYNLLGRSLPSRFLKHLEYLFAPKHRKTLAYQRDICRGSETRFLAVSHFVAEQLHQTGWVPSERIRVLHNGVDLERFKNEKMADFRDDTRARSGLKAHHVAFLFVGHNLGLKNFALVDRVFRLYADRVPNGRLVVMGKRNPKSKNPAVIYAGATSEPERYYAAADVLLHPTFFDACSNAVLEALACGLPVVTSDLNGSAEIIDNGNNGIVLPVVGVRGDIEHQWLNAIVRLTKDPAERGRMGREARVVAERHSMDRYVDQFEALLQEIAAGSGR